MKTHCWSKIIALALCLSALAVMWLPTEVVQAQVPSGFEELAERYAPVLYFHSEELFRPQTVDVILDTARLRRIRRNRLDVTVLPRILSMAQLFDYPGPDLALDVWYGDEGASEYANYSSHRAYYQDILSPEAGGPPITAYAHIVRDEDTAQITIQYWLLYFYNDSFNKHEGDWELVQVVLDAGQNPQWVVLSQHHGGTRRPWSAVQVEAGTHLVAYVALGSHANYFAGNEIYPNGVTIGNVRLEIMDRTGSQQPTIPRVILIPGRHEVEADPASWSDFAWLAYRGRWGETAPQGDLSGPFGPADKGMQWEQPYAWGMAQPLDVDVWYANRLRVAVEGQAAEHARVALSSTTGHALPLVDELGSVVLLHAEPPQNAVVVADIEAAPGIPYALHATWPDAQSARVTRYRFDEVTMGPSGRATLTMQEGALPVLRVVGSLREREPSAVETAQVTWDAADPVWLAGFLPAGEVLRGLAFSLLAGFLPTLLYVVLLYSADRYEKEPKAMLAAAFLWGAIPALLVALAVRLFFDLPAQLLGPKAIEAVRAGFVAPLVEEAIKGAVILFIATHYRLEFDGLLDGIVYGAMVGFGFAMAGNTLSYVGAFVLRGFAGLSRTILLEGVLYGLNHALYSAIVGAGLGYARLAQTRRQRWGIPLAAFALAVLVHALHNVALYAAVGINLATATMNWAGILVIVAIVTLSLRREQQCLATELVGEVPEAVYQALTTRAGRSRAQWRALRTGGLHRWREVRHTHQQCAELAIKKMQRARLPHKVGLEKEIDRLRRELAALLDKAS